MRSSEPLFLKAALTEYRRWIDWLARHPFTSQVRLNFVREIEDAVYGAASHPFRYPLEGYRDYRRVGPTAIYQFRIIYAVRDEAIVIVAISHPSRRPRYWARRKII